MNRTLPGASTLPLALAALLAACGSSGSGASNVSAQNTPDGGSSDGGSPGGGSPAPAGATLVWTVPESATHLTSDQQAAFAAGNLYYNAHTAAHPSGEIRGQLDKKGTAVLASLDGAQETPPVTTSAFGGALFTIDESTGAISGFVVTSGLVGANASHVHIGARGAPGAIIVPLSGGPDVWVVPDGAAPLTSDQLAAFRNGGLYVNVHTAAHPGGEIRGQLDKKGTPRFASLTGSQETPPTAATGRGGAVIALDASGKAAGFIVTTGVDGASAAHVHLGAAGAPGSIILPLSGGSSLWVVPDGAAALTPDQVTAFGAGNLYVNVHTPAHPGGEIRGQLDRAGALRLASLDGSQETPPTASTAFGAGALILDDSGSGETGGFLVTSGLVDPNAAHFHNGARGAAGPVLVPLTGP